MVDGPDVTDAEDEDKDLRGRMGKEERPCRSQSFRSTPALDTAIREEVELLRNADPSVTVGAVIRWRLLEYYGLWPPGVRTPTTAPPSHHRDQLSTGEAPPE